MQRNAFYISSFFCLTLAIVLLCLSGCSTQKDRWINRSYHNVTAHYNAWWNGNEALKTGVLKIEQNHKDDYTRTLSIFPSSSAHSATLVKSEMDRAIEKGSKVIKKHSMRIDGKERCAEIDDAYLLIGKACFYNRDYKSAEATFKHVAGQWKNEPPMYEAMVWLAMTYLHKGDYSACETMLDQVKNKAVGEKPNQRLAKQIYLIYAENCLKQRKNAQALQYLILANDVGVPRKYKARVYFIMGQLYMNGGENVRAGYYFKKAAAKAKNYEMQFSAKLNVAMCYDPKKQDSKAIIALLSSMANDRRNEEYQDQIYYALGEVYMRDKNVAKACESWEKSVSTSRTNKMQKIGSALKVAKTYYDILEEYEKSQQYFDTALTLMPKDDPEYATVVSKQEVLTQLVKNIRIVAQQDSLLAVADLPQAEIEKRIAKRISEHQKREQEKAAAAKIAAAEAARLSSMPDYGQANNNSGWYFYNTVALQNGKNEFMRIWGKRENEDLWMLSHKEMQFDTPKDANDQSDVDENQNDTTQIDSTTRQLAKAANDPNQKAFYLKDLPQTPEAKAKSHEMIADALLNQGYIYYQGINNYGKALEAFLLLLKRYPQHANALPAYFHLYRLYDKMGKTPSANYYKNQILTQYPNSEYAMMIQNPLYWVDLGKGQSDMEKEYLRIYNRFSQKDYPYVATEARKWIDSLRFGQYIPKLLYLEAVSKCKMGGSIDSLISHLNYILINYPKHEISQGIEDQLRFLSANKELIAKNMSYSQTDNQTAQTPHSQQDTMKNNGTSFDAIKDFSDGEDDILDAESLLYRYRDVEHYYIILAADNDVNAAEMSLRVSDFNQKYFSVNQLAVSNMLFSLSEQIITVKKFESIEEAMRYYSAIKESDEVFGNINQQGILQFVISTQNYPTLYNRKSIAAYGKFFRVFYLQNNNEKKE